MLVIRLNYIETIDNQGLILLIGVTVNQLDYINYSPEQGFQQYVTFPKITNNITVELRDNNNNILPMNGIDFFLIFERM